MAGIRSYRDLLVWQEAMDLVIAVHGIAAQIPRNQGWTLGDQLRRSAISIPSNLAEGHSRGSRTDFLRFVRIARGSLSELETQLELVERLGFSTEAALKPVQESANRVGRMLSGLRRRLESRS